MDVASFQNSKPEVLAIMQSCQKYRNGSILFWYGRNNHKTLRITDLTIFSYGYNMDT
jgi:hypothetical protein